MRSPTTVHVQCALLVQRLMDADLLLPEEGNTLLREIEAWSPPEDNANAQGTHTAQLSQALQAILQATHLDATARQAALETAHALIHQSAEATAPETQSGKSCD